MQTETVSRSLDLVEGNPFDGRSVPPIPDSFGRRLRAVRERRRISIASIAESTKILGALLEGLENDDVSRWPTGLYRRAFIRAYAVAIGLDPEPIVREFIARFPDPEDAAPLPMPIATPGPRAVLRLTLAEPGGLAGATLGQTMTRRVIAVAADAGVIGLLGAGLYMVLGAFWAPVTLAVIAYYFVGILVLGNTPGVCLAASARGSAGRGDTPIRLAAGRWFQHWFARTRAGWLEWLARR
jgi:hypothetical protein